MIPYSSLESCLRRVLRTAISISIPPFLYRLMEAVFSHSLGVWEEERENGEGTEEEQSSVVCAGMCACVCMHAYMCVVWFCYDSLDPKQPILPAEDCAGLLRGIYS